MEQNQTQKHDENRRGCQQNAHDAEACDGHAGKVEPGKGQLADKPCSNEAPEVLQADFQVFPVEQQQIHPDKNQAQRDPDLNNFQGAQPVGVHFAHIDAHASPEGAGEQNV